LWVLLVGQSMLDLVSLTGAANLRVKESDRVAVMARELTRLGADVDELPSSANRHPPFSVLASRAQPCHPTKAWLSTEFIIIKGR
jgi:hypothetical protein